MKFSIHLFTFRWSRHV